MVLVKNPERTIPGELFYHDIGDHLNREEKLFMLRVSQSGTPTLADIIPTPSASVVALCVRLKITVSAFPVLC